MNIASIALIFTLTCVKMLEASVRYTVADLGVIVDTDGSFTLGKVPPESLTLDPTEDPHHVIVEVRKLSLFDSENSLIKAYNFSTHSGSFDLESDPVHDFEGAPTDGRQMSATQSLSDTFGPNIMDFNEYVFIKSSSTDLGEESVDVELYDTLVEVGLGPVEDTEKCDACAERLDHMQLDIRLTTSGESRMDVKAGVTRVHKSGGVQLLLPSAITLDGELQSTEDNPDIKIEGDHVDVSLQVPSFTDSAIYRALVVLSKPEAPTPPSTPEEKEDDEEEEEEEGILDDDPEEKGEAEYSFSTNAPNSEEKGVVVGDEKDDGLEEGNGIEKGEETGDGSNVVDGEDENNSCSLIMGKVSVVLAAILLMVVAH